MTTSTLLPRTDLWRAWYSAIRPATLPASAAPVIVGTAAARPFAEIHVLPFLTALLSAILIQIGTNFANDVFDFRKGSDTDQRLGPKRLIQANLATPELVFRAACLCFATAALLGLYLIYVGGLPILLIGGLSIVSGVAYTGGPFPLGYHGLGDIFAFAFFGPVAVIGSAYLQTLQLEPASVLASIPMGLLVTAILVANNLRDIETDCLSGKRTLAVRLGRRATRIQYTLFMMASYLFPFLLRLEGRISWWFWLPWLTAPLALSAIRDILHEVQGPPLIGALKKTGRVELFFGLLLSIAFWV